MAQVNSVERVFVVGGTRLADPTPGSDLKTATRTLAMNYPQFRWADLYEEDGVIEGGTLVFTLQLPPPKVNG